MADPGDDRLRGAFRDVILHYVPGNVAGTSPDWVGPGIEYQFLLGSMFNPLTMTRMPEATSEPVWCPLDLWSGVRIKP
jgi:hypothetical protein